jgi:malate/lactate dehydrogenase
MAENIDGIIHDFRKESERSAKVMVSRKFSAAVIGTGTDKSVGAHIADRLSEDSRIDKVVLCDRTKSNVKWLLSNLRSSGKCAEGGYESIRKWIFNEGIDLAVICAGHFFENRDDELEYNSREIIQKIAPQFQGYNGAVVILTNPVDAVAYQFAILSQCNPASILGFSQIDAERGRIIIEEKAVRKLGSPVCVENFFTIGAHNFAVKGGSPVYCMIPLLKNTTINGIPAEAVFPELYDELAGLIPKYGIEQYSREDGAVVRTASKLIAKTFCGDVLDAFSSDKAVSMSAWLPEFGLYAVWPVKISGLTAVPERIALDEKVRAAFERVRAEVLMPNIRKLKKMGLEGAPVKEHYSCSSYRGAVSESMSLALEKIRRAAEKRKLSESEIRAAHRFYGQCKALSEGISELNVPEYMHCQVHPPRRKKGVLALAVVASLATLPTAVKTVYHSLPYYEMPSAEHRHRIRKNAFSKEGYFVMSDCSLEQAVEFFDGFRKSGNLDVLMNSLQEDQNNSFFSGKVRAGMLDEIRKKYEAGVSAVCFVDGSKKYYSVVEKGNFYLLLKVDFGGFDFFVECGAIAVLTPFGADARIEIFRKVGDELRAKAEKAEMAELH